MSGAKGRQFEWRRAEQILAVLETGKKCTTDELGALLGISRTRTADICIRLLDRDKVMVSAKPADGRGRPKILWEMKS
jgi:predicted ArsR family transcriptional regulator